MTTYNYIRSIKDRQKSLAERQRLLIDEPIAAFVNAAHKRSPKLAVEKYAEYLVSEFGALKFVDNLPLFNGERDFIVDRKSGYAFLSLHGQHAHLMKALYSLYNEVESKEAFEDITTRPFGRRYFISVDNRNNYEMNYLEENYGFFMSSKSTRTDQRKPTVTMSETYQLTEEEKNVFKDFNIDIL